MKEEKTGSSVIWEHCPDFIGVEERAVVCRKRYPVGKRIFGGRNR